MLRLEFCLLPISHIPLPLHSSRAPKSLPCLAAVSRNSDLNPDAIPAPKPKPKPKPKHQRCKIETAANELPRKPRRCRRSEAAAVADYITDMLSKTFATIKEQNPDIDFETKSPAVVDDDEDEEENEEESKDWLLDAEGGWGIRASECFENHGIRNVVDENGVEIDWEGEIEDN